MKKKCICCARPICVNCDSDIQEISKETIDRLLINEYRMHELFTG